MRPSIHVYNLPAGEVVELARASERLGFDGLWLGEHIFIPAEVHSVHPGREVQSDTAHAPILETSTSLFDPWVAMGAIAAATTRLKVGLGVYLVPLRHPLLTARAAASVQDVSGGRLSIGVGVGWLAEEFDALDVPFAGRGKRTEEAIEVLRAAWQGGFFEHHGACYSFSSLQVTPHPTPVPLIIGGNSRTGMDRAARIGDGWISSGTPSVTQALELRAELARHLAEHRVDRPFRYIVRAPSLDASVLEQYADQGFDEVIFHVNQGIADRHGGWQAWLEEVADTVDPLRSSDPVDSAPG